MPFQFGIATPPVYEGNLFTALQHLSLTTNLKVCLDAGVAASYTSGQKWLDLAGSGYDFFLGADGAATGTDPTFNGVVGAQTKSEYWSFDGGDYFTYDTTNEAWMQTLHKDNAIFSFVCWIYLGSVGPDIGIWGTAGTGAAATGVTVKMATNTISVNVYNAGAVVKTATSTPEAKAGGWYFLGAGLNETGNTAAFVTKLPASPLSGNESVETTTFTYSSPAAGSATYTMGLASGGNAAALPPNNSRMASLAIWQGTALTTTQLLNIYNATVAKFNG